jgi:hypothetical protein
VSKPAEAHTASYPMGTGGGGSFPEGKARPGRDADHSPPTCAEIKNDQELHSSPRLRLHDVAGQLYFYTLHPYLQKFRFNGPNFYNANFCHILNVISNEAGASF